MELDIPHYFRTSSIGSSSTNTAASTSELFICFASRLSSSSSSMKLSKSILSPGRATRDCGPVSLTSSLSRRLRTNGSLKGGQASPFFTFYGKKRGCSFENPEPSSPKVTCIGQVRVKTKKKVKQTRSFSKRRGGDLSFRKIELGGVGAYQGEDITSSQQRFSNPSAHAQTQQQSQECLTHRNQRWVHLPISICEGFRSFGSEFSCFFPCKGSCFSTSEREKSEERGPGENENGCGAVFTRWLVSVNDGEGGKRREIELVVGGGDEEEILAERYSMRSSRRHVFEDIEVKNDRIEVKGQSLEGEEEAARVSICIPPKNALLLMRCRSDPMKMASLANKFSWDAKAAHKVEYEDIKEGKNDEPVGKDVDEFEEVQNGDTISVESEEQENLRGCDVKDEIFRGNKAETGEEEDVSVEHIDEQETLNQAEVISEIGAVCVEEKSQGLLIISLQEMEEKQEQESAVTKEMTLEEEEEEEEVESNMSSFEALLDQENAEHFGDYPVQLEEEAEDASLRLLTSSNGSDEEESEGNKMPTLHHDAAMEKKDGEETQESNPSFTECYDVNKEETQLNCEEKSSRKDGTVEQKEATSPTVTGIGSPENREFLVGSQDAKKGKESHVLPDCLLLMMCEPKLSMEVSKETWVCSTDFLRWLPERPLKPPAKPAKVGSGGEQGPIKSRLSVDSKPKPNSQKEKHELQQPRRSSCSLPPATAAASRANIIEQELVNAVAYEPLALTRCKSEPMSTAAAKLLPESHFWKNAIRKLEPHSRATLGAARVGF
ncbi:uncharacterized protein [Primulina eburnea]|uniref:uncharacterized protein n=1 Tax=Primulina eburnea TaxID=1245227 RepID=UPI003C6C9F17